MTTRHRSIRRARGKAVETTILNLYPPKEDPPNEPSTKKALIVEIARKLEQPRFTAVEIEQIRRQLIAKLGAPGKTSSDYIVSVLKEAGQRVVLSRSAR